MKKQPKQSRLVRLLWQRMYDRHESTCVMVYGKKGKGKSYLSMRLSELLDSQFSIVRVCFGAEEFIRLLDSNLPPGSCVVYDEIGVGSNSRRSQTRANIDMSFIAQLIRPSEITVFFTTISWALVDAQVRNLMDYAIRADGFDKPTETSVFKFYAIEPKQNSPEPFRKNLVFHIKGHPIKHVSWTCKAPSKELRVAYEKMRKEYMSEHFKRSNTGKVVIDAKGKPSLKLSDAANYVKDHPEEFKIGKHYSTILVSEKFNFCTTTAQRVATLAKSRETHTEASI